MWNERLETVHVEVVGNEVFVYLAIELVSPCITEPCDKTGVCLFIVKVLLRLLLLLFLHVVQLIEDVLDLSLELLVALLH